MGFRIASFNMYKFSNISDDTIKKNMSMIANIIRNEEIDIIALQEIFNQYALERLIGELGNHRWDGAWAKPNSRLGTAIASEGYAFLWRKDRIELAQNREGKIFQPRILNQYKVDKSFGQRELIRNPFYGRFVVRANRMIEFRLINTHIIFSKDRAINESDNHDENDDLSAVKMRRNELDILVKAIFPKMADKAYDQYMGEGDALCSYPYTILLGDYNLNLKESNASGATILEPLVYLQDGPNVKTIITDQKQLSTLRAKSLQNPDEPIVSLKNNYDHFTYDSQRSMALKCYAVDPLQRGYYSESYDLYKKEVSDHLMVVSEIELI